MPKRFTPTTLASPMEKKKKKQDRALMPPPPQPRPQPTPSQPLQPQPPHPPRPVPPTVLRRDLPSESYLSRRIKLSVHPDGVILTDTDKTENPDHAIRLNRGGWTALKQVMDDFNLARVTPYQWDVDEDSTVPSDVHRDVELSPGLYASQRGYKKHIYVHLKYWMLYKEGDRHYPSRLGITLSEEAWATLTSSDLRLTVDTFLATNPPTATERVNPTPMQPLDHATRQRLQDIWMRCFEDFLTPVLSTLQKKYCGVCAHIPEATQHTCLTLNLTTAPGFIPFLPEALERLDTSRLQRHFRQRVRDQQVTSPANVDVFLNRFAVKQDDAHFERVFTTFLEKEEATLADLLDLTPQMPPITTTTPKPPTLPTGPSTVPDEEEDFDVYSQVIGF